MSIVFNKELAEKADGGSYITTGGVYVGKITKAVCFNKESGSGGVEFAFESKDGQKVDYMKVYTKNKDGSENFAIGKIHSLMGLLGVNQAETKKENGNTVISNFLNKNIAIRIQKEEYPKTDGSTGFKFDILNFLDFQTMKTYTEFSKNTEAKTYLRKVEDNLISGSDVDTSDSYSQEQTVDSEPKEDLPF